MARSSLKNQRGLKPMKDVVLRLEKKICPWFSAGRRVVADFYAGGRVCLRFLCLNRKSVSDYCYSYCSPTGTVTATATAISTATLNGCVGAGEGVRVLPPLSYMASFQTSASVVFHKYSFIARRHRHRICQPATRHPAESESELETNKHDAKCHQN